MDSIDIGDFCQLLESEKTYADVSNRLQATHPGVRGFSVESIKKFCKKNGLSIRVSQREINEMVYDAVESVCCVLF